MTGFADKNELCHKDRNDTKLSTVSKPGVYLNTHMKGTREVTGTIIAQPLTSKDYAPYGDVIHTGDKTDMTSANQGTADKFHHVAQVTNTFPDNKGKMNLCIFHCRPTPHLPFRVRLLERHPYSSQAFIPMSDKHFKGYLVIVALNGKDDRPDMSTLKAFIASSTQGINYRQGVWHHPMVVLGHPCDFTVLVHESGISQDDCQEVDTPEVVVEVPSFLQ